MEEQEPNLGPAPCRWCNGTGKNNALHRRSLAGACRACGGPGSVLVYLPARACTACGGTGVHNAAGYMGPEHCHICSGTGWQYHLPIPDDWDQI